MFNDPIETCSTCELPIIPNDPDDFRHHEEVHERRHYMLTFNGVLPASKRERERMKHDGDEKRRTGATIAERADGAVMVVSGHYHRDLARFSEDRGRWPAQFRDYIARYPLEQQFTADEASEIRRRLADRKWDPIP